MNGPKVLVVEDSPTMRQLIVFALRRIRGLAVSEAGNGLEGLKKLAADRFDLIVTDINMPVMDGLKLVSLARRDPVYREVPIVVITTEGADESRDRALALGASEYIYKPIRTAHLVDVARRLLGLSS